MGNFIGTIGRGFLSWIVALSQNFLRPLISREGQCFVYFPNDLQAFFRQNPHLFCVIIKEYVVVLTWQFSWICAYIFLIFMKLKQPLVYILKLYRFMCTVGKSKFHFRIRYMYLFSNSSVNFSYKIGSIYSVFSRNFCKWLKGGLDFQEKNQK